ncbi:uncharacterized protein Tco025E_09793 [Trypanosoma conorhini]|uniref:Uncharacterized protein n=1 Tax=Trypanosoma conorhini TaxID=83891 RepID=A0A422MX63_9TRYP|nr:uncharacterized protein Tco025E_09793 [Trypanosoma conorhini]RNE97844.1 hypothetical protein Tco025E_09793 [Trypanosoma conorhini]
MTLTVLAAFGFYLVQRHNCGRFACLFFGRSFSINEFPTHGLHTHKVVYFAGVYVFAVPVFFCFRRCAPLHRAAGHRCNARYSRKNPAWGDLGADWLLWQILVPRFLRGVLLVGSGPQLKGVASAAVRAGFYFFFCGNGTFHFYWGMARPPSGAATRHFAKNASSKGPVAGGVPEAQPNGRARGRHAKELAGRAVG